jgi:hypothetical protein
MGEKAVIESPTGYIRNCTERAGTIIRTSSGETTDKIIVPHIIRIKPKALRYHILLKSFLIKIRRELGHQQIS